VRDRLGLVHYQPLGACRKARNVYVLATERSRGGGRRERRTCWKKLSTRMYTVLSSARGDTPVPWCLEVDAAMRLRRAAGESVRSVAISLGRTEGAVRSPTLTLTPTPTPPIDADPNPNSNPNPNLTPTLPLTPTVTPTPTLTLALTPTLSLTRCVRA
jgi:hypothetical protein